MTKRRYSQEVVDYIKKNAIKYTNKELAEKVNKKFGTDFNVDRMGDFILNRKIKHKSTNPRLSHPSANKKPIGSEWVRSDGMVLVKVAEPSVWQYKQRVIYEQYHNIKIPKDKKIIFLNQDRNDYSIENLMMVNAKDSLIAFNKKLLSVDKEVTKTGIMVAGVINKLKEMEDMK